MKIKGRLALVTAMSFLMTAACIGCGGGGGASSGEFPGSEGAGFYPDPAGLSGEDGTDEDGDVGEGEYADGGDNGGSGPFEDYDNDGIPNGQDPDADNDGYTVADGDCNDLNEHTYPGAPDRPDFPAYIDSNCDGIDGDLGRSIWVADNGNDNNPGTIDMPLLTIVKAIQKATVNIASVKDVYAAGGTYTEDAVLSSGVGMFGGFGPLEQNGLRSRDIALYQTDYHCALTSFVIGPSGQNAGSVVEGFTFEAVPGHTAVIVINSSPEIRHNKIYGADGVQDSYAVAVFSLGLDKESRALLLRNFITSADATARQGVSVGVVASAWGRGSETELTLDGNEIKSGVAGKASIGVYMVAVNPADAVLVAKKNAITAGSALDLTSGIVLGFDVAGEANYQFTRADIFQNRIYGGVGAALISGVSIMNAADKVGLHNNFITGGFGSMVRTAGVFVYDSEVSIIGNTINAGGSKTDAVAVHLGLDAVTDVVNNIFCAEEALTRTGVHENTATSVPDTLRNNMFCDHLDVMYRDFSDGDILNVAAVNVIQDIVEIGDNIDGEPMFVNPGLFDYHLMGDSPAIDAGFELADALRDIDDELSGSDGRTDIGADEFSNAQ